MGTHQKAIVMLDEEVLKLSAFVLGPDSAPQRALDQAQLRRARGEEVVFLQRAETLVVMPKATLAALGGAR